MVCIGLVRIHRCKSSLSPAWLTRPARKAGTCMRRRPAGAQCRAARDPGWGCRAVCIDCRRGLLGGMHRRAGGRISPGSGCRASGGIRRRASGGSRAVLVNANLRYQQALHCRKWAKGGCSFLLLSWQF